MTNRIDLRRALHQIPEVGLQLPQTQAMVLEALDGLPLEITLGTSVTSVVGVLRGDLYGTRVKKRPSGRARAATPAPAGPPTSSSPPTAADSDKAGSVTSSTAPPASPASATSPPTSCATPTPPP